MDSKLISEIDNYLHKDHTDSRHIKLNSFKARNNLREQRKAMQKRLFGEHYNYSKIGLNREKKFMIEEQKNTQIERSNRILLQKIQRIAKRSGGHVNQRKRTLTEHQDMSFHSAQSNSIPARKFESPSKSLHHLLKVSDKMISKSPRMTLKIFFEGSLVCENVVIPVRTYIENSNFTVAADIGRIKQKIIIGIESYRTFFKDKLQADHSKIMDFLTFNGKYLQLSGINNQRTYIEEHQQSILPPIAAKAGTKGFQRTHTKGADNLQQQS